MNDLEKEIVDLYQEGWTVPQIRRKLVEQKRSRGEGWIRRLLRQTGVVPEGESTRHPPAGHRRQEKVSPPGLLVVTLTNERVAKSIPQGVMAEELGCTPPKLSKWESGRREPTVQHLHSYAAMLGGSLTVTLEGRDGVQLAIADARTTTERLSTMASAVAPFGYRIVAILTLPNRAAIRVDSHIRPGGRETD